MSSRPPRARVLGFQQHSRFIGLVVVVGIGIMLAAGLPALQNRAPDRTDLLLGILGTLTLLPSGIALVRKAGDILEPISITGILFFLYFAMRAIYLIYGSPRLEDVPPRLGYGYAEFIEPALEFTICCWGAAMVGYYLPLGAMAARRLPVPRMLRSEVDIRGATILWAVGVGFRLLQIVRGTHLSFAKSENLDVSTQSYIDLGCMLDLIALFLLGTAYFQKRLDRTGRLLLFAAVLPESVLVGFISGSKWLMLLPIITFLASSHYFRSRLGLRHGLALAALLVFVAIPLGQSMRAAFGRSDKATDFSVDGTRETAALAAAEVREHVNDDMGAYLDEAMRSTTSRMHGLDSVMVALKMTPTFIPYVDASLYYQAPIMAVAPRILWKSKPIMDPVPRWATDYWGQPADSPSSIATTHTGALYLAFGWLGAAVGMLILGVLWRVIYAYPARVASPIAWCSYFFILMSIIRIENDIPSVYVGITKVMLLLAIVARFASKRAPVRHVAPAFSRA